MRKATDRQIIIEIGKATYGTLHMLIGKAVFNYLVSYSYNTNHNSVLGDYQKVCSIFLIPFLSL